MKKRRGDGRGNGERTRGKEGEKRKNINKGSAGMMKKGKTRRRIRRSKLEKSKR